MKVIERRLCGFEENLVQRTLNNIYYNFAIAVRYSKPLSLPDLKSFLTELCNKWPQLVMQIKNNVARPLKLIKFGDIVVNLSERTYACRQDAITDIFKEYTNYQFKYDSESSSPLWKIIVYKDILVFLADHTLLDGTAGRLFHQFAGEYIEAQNGIASQNTCSYDDIIFSLANHPNLIINPSPAGLQKDYFPPDGWSPPKAIANAIPNFDKELLKLPLVNHYSTFYQIPNTLVSKMVSIARSHNVKITSVIFGLVSTSLMSAGILNGEVLTSVTAVNTRFKNKPQNGVQEYPFASLYAKYNHATHIANGPLSFKDDMFWRYCEDFHSGLNASLDECLYLTGHLEKAFLSDPKLPSKTMQALSSMKKNANPSVTLFVSNLGAISSDKCTYCWFDSAMVDSAFGCYLLGTPSEICINFTAHRATSAEDYNAYVKSSMEAFDSFFKKS